MEQLTQTDTKQVWSSNKSNKDNLNKLNNNNKDVYVNSPNGNTSHIRARRWCLTINNYTENDFDTINKYFTEKKYSYIIGKENGQENNTPHLQIYLETKNPISFKNIKKNFPTAHIEKAKGSKQENFNYCSKENNFTTNITLEKNIEDEILKIEYNNVLWKNWQQEILNIINEKPDQRKIFWYWDETGNKGKSFLCKYIVLKYDAVICSGKTNDIFNQLNNWRLNNKNNPQLPIIVFDVPRSDYYHVNYSAIEQIKNGCCYSGKYEGGKIIGLKPHVIIFANSPPNEDTLSKDKIIITELV